MKFIMDNIDNLFFDYLDNNLSKENKLKLELLLQQSEELRDHKDKLEEIWDGKSKHDSNINLTYAIYRFNSRVKKDIEKDKKKEKVRGFLPYLKIAGVLLLLFGMSYWSYYMGINARTGHMVTFSCSAGEKASTILPDGSEVFINSESSISYNTDFMKETRDVYLTGEAYFMVHADKSNPFNVIANDMKVTATGTKFNVNAYDSESCLETSLIEGVVNISNENKSYTLDAGEVLSINKKTNKWTKKELRNNDLYIGWKDGKLIFKNEPLSSLVSKFERFYDVKIITESAVDTIRFSGTLQYESIDELLNILKETQGIIAKKEGKSIYLSMKNKKK